MKEVRVLTVPLDPRTGLFDDTAVRAWLADRELLRLEPRLVHWQGRPFWSLLVVTRPLEGAEARRAGTPRPQSPPPDGGAPPGPDAEPDVMSEVAQVRYQKLLAWRRGTARAEGLPPYVLFTNSQARTLAHDAPRTLSALGAVRGIGAKRVAKHGRAILEVLHGPEPEGGTVGSGPLREVDGHEPLDLRANEPDAAVDPPQPDPPDREPDPRDPRGHHDGGLP